ncbi:MAG: hypothetical protein HY597_07420 [Candidatus Omnitrophica bacterium]|nr:hypothetical protein [Candidatus Omnitrophota bacterium]
MSRLLPIPYTELPVPPSEAFPDVQKRDYPVLPVALSYQGRVTAFTFFAIIDSGADNCIFPAIVGRELGIPVEAGSKLLTTGVAGGGIAYFHQVRVLFRLDNGNYNFDCYAGFMPSLDQVGVGLLGRHGFFDLFEKVAFNNTARIVELTARD